MNAKDSGDGLTIALMGDIVLDAPNPDFWLSGLKPLLDRADIVIGHLEVPHTDSQIEVSGDVPAPGSPPEHLDALTHIGVDAVTLAGNHIADCGEIGIMDTVRKLDILGIKHTGAGRTIREARQPALIHHQNVILALLSYNCVGPEFSWATEAQAGCSYLDIRPEDGGPVAPAKSLVHITDEAIRQLNEDIAKARQQADFVIVALHKGIVHTPATLASYEREIARLCVEAGADLVVGHHAHIVRGIEIVQSTPIFHGLGNGCVVTEALSPDQNHPARAEWAEKRKALFGFEPDPAYRLAPFHPEAVNAMIGYVTIRDEKIAEVGIWPVDVVPPGQPVAANKDRSREIASYIEKITEQAGMPPISLIDRGHGYAIQ